MAATSETIQPSEEPLYKFRFGTSNKVAQLTQRQLERIPYLAALVAHTDDFSTNRNEHGEYVLSSRFRYTWFTAIVRSITKEQAFFLFTELPCHANVLGMLQLYEYLCMDPIPVPLLKNENFARSRCIEIDIKTNRVQYHQANLSEARNTAVEFVIALSKQEYDLNDSKTRQRIFALTMIILGHTNIFGLRFCHHTLTVMDKYCFSFFSRSQQRELDITRRNIQDNIDSDSSVNDDSELLPGYFQNVFSWRGIYEPTDDDDIDCLSTSSEDTSSWRGFSSIETLIAEYQRLFAGNVYFSWLDHYDPFSDFSQQIEEHRLWLTLRTSLGESQSYQLLPVLRERASLIIENPHDAELYVYQITEERKKQEARSARCGLFNTMSKRPITDKFKHTFSPKAKKY